VLAATGIFSEVLFYTPSAAKSLGLLTYVELAMKIRKYKPEVLFYLTPLSRSRTQVWRDWLFFQAFCGVSQVYGLEATKHLFGLRDENGNLTRLPFEADRLLSITGQARIDVPEQGEAKYRVPIGRRETTRIDDLWREAMLPRHGRMIAIGLGSKMPAKRWPLNRFVVLAMRLLDTWPDARLLILGGHQDREIGKKIRSAVGIQVVNWAGQLTVLESAEALRRCALYVGNDTGTMHLAAAVGTTCVAIFSARDHPGIWEPYGKGHIVLRKDVPCAGCLLTVCEQRGMMCLLEISVDEVLNGCLQALPVSI